MGEASGKRRKVAFPSGDANADFCLAKDCIKLHLVSTIGDFQDGCPAFSPTFLEEHFGESGRIYGYRGLKVDIWLHSASFHAYADVKYDSVVSNRKKSHQKLDDILKGIFGNGLVANRDVFAKQLATYNSQFSDLLTKHAEHIASWQAPTTDSSSGGDKQNQVFRLELASRESREWQQRLNPLVLWFIEGASCIEVDDPRWEVYVAVETTRGSHKVTGFCNVYRFFHYPDSTRLRISQILVLPPYQNQHYGFHLVNAVNEIAARRDSFDVTMEDPSDKLQLLRDCMDVMRLLNSSPFMSQLARAAERVKEGKAAAGELLPPLSLVSEVRREFKISKGQCRRCWEAMVLLHLNPADDDLFTQLVSKRLCDELFDNKENERPKLKHVVDTENQYDSSKTFVMMKFKHTAGGEEAQAQEEESDASQRDQTLKELLTEKRNHILSVVKRVASLCKMREIPVQFNPQAWIDQS